MLTFLRRRNGSSSGFTLIELLVVICIIGILTALTTVGILAALNSARANSSETMLSTISAALAVYQQKWGDYPPSTIDELGVRPQNDINNGVEALVACLSSKKRGGPVFTSEDHLDNVDGDSASKNVTDWYFGDNQLREYCDYFGWPIFYMHHKDFARPKASITTYRLSRDGGEEVKIAPEVNPATKAFTNADKFQLRSVGRDGKPGTSDDVRPGN